MTHKDSEWRPTGAMVGYDGYELWAYKVGPHLVNEGEVDGDIEFEDVDD